MTALRSLVLLLLFVSAAFAQPAPGQTLRLQALGGAAVDIPAWKEVRKEAGVAIYEQVPDPATQKPYYVLMCTLEEGPPKDQPIAWEKVRDNIIAAASKNQRALTLEVKDAYTGAASFEGRRFVGEFRSGPDKRVQIELIALVKDGKLLTIGLVAEELGQMTTDLVQGVARSARLGL